jgi:hypothetical protein
MSAWWCGLSPAQTTIACNDAEHRLRWEAGALLALDHDDLDAERTLAALAGEPCACVQVVDRWQRCATDLRVLTLASRGPADTLSTRASEVSWAGPRQRGGTMFAVSVGGGPPTFGDDDELERDDDDPTPLLGLGGGLGNRLTAGVAAHWRDRTAERDAERFAALYGRLAAALRSWLEEPDLELDLELVRNDAPQHLQREGETVHAALPFAWVPDVWTRGLAIVAGRLTLAAVASDDGTRWELTTVGPDLSQRQQITLRLHG